MIPRVLVACGFAALAACGCSQAAAASLVVDLGKAKGVTLVGAVSRLDSDGNPRREVDPKAKIDAPQVDAAARRDARGRWVFRNLPPGKYDLVILTKDRLRIEGWQYAPVKEFDPVFAPTATTDEETRRAIADDIAQSKHYENKVVPLAMGGDSDAVRVLVMLIRDKQTTYNVMPDAATMRHEIWQFSWAYGAWQKERRTRVLDRTLMHRDELRKWTWLWDAKLGGVEATAQPATLSYELPPPGEKKLPGLYPY